MLGSNNLMMKKKTIWFINKDAAPIEFYGTHLRTIKLAQYFQSEGYNVKLFCSSYVHNRNLCLSDSNKTFEEKTYDNIPFVLVNAGCGSTNGIRRIISYFRFAVKLFIHRKQFEKPDVIIHTSRIPFDIPIYQLAKKVKAKYIVDVTDLWPDSFVSLGLLGKNNPCVKIAYCLERYIYSKADNVVFSMPVAVNYVRENGWDSDQGGTIDLNKLHYINNGIDLSEFNVNMQRYKIEDFDLANDKTFNIIYLGSIRLANNLKLLIDSAKILQNNSVQVLIYGDGEDRAFLEHYCEEQQITNVKFKAKWTSPEYVPYILSKADVNALNYSTNFGKYGGSMNKMFLGLASGKPLCCNVGMPYSIILEEGVGIDCKLTDPQDYAAAILSLKNLPSDEYQTICNKAKKAAEKYDYAKLCVKFKDVCNL